LAETGVDLEQTNDYSLNYIASERSLTIQALPKDGFGDFFPEKIAFGGKEQVIYCSDFKW